MSLPIGIIGGGLIAGFHVAALQALGATIAVVADPQETPGRRLAAQAGATYVADYHDLLANPAVPAVIIATPNFTHYPIALDALDAGKHVFCEKPMTTNPQDSAELVARVRRRPNQVFQIGYMKRFNPAFQFVKQSLPQLGDLLNAHIRVLTYLRAPTAASWHGQPERVGGGILSHSGSHLLDVTRMLFGDPTRVDARVQDVPEREGFDRSSLTLIDMASGLTLYFSTLGVAISKIGSTQEGWEETVEVIGTNGRISLSSPNWQGTMPCVVTLQLDAENQKRTIYFDGPTQWEAQMKAFLAHLADTTPAKPDVVDGYKVDELIGTIYASGRERTPRPIEWRI